MADPVPQKITSIWPPLLLLAVSLGYVAWAQKYGAVPRLMPTLVGGATAALAVLDLLSRFDSRLGRALRLALGADFRNREMSHDPAIGREAAMIGWMLAALASIWLIGLLPTVPLFITAYMRLWGRLPLSMAALSGVAVLGFVVVVFEVLLDYALYRGWLVEALL
ncbi:tripartite tricarboxylate transporter TctB family protein [Roseivivax sp. CAU 1761]